MKQYQITTLLVILLTIFTVYQMQKGLFERTQEFLVQSYNSLSEDGILVTAQSYTPNKKMTYAQPQTPVAVKKPTVTKKCLEIKREPSTSSAKGIETTEVQLVQKVSTQTQILVKEKKSAKKNCLGVVLF